ncbi:MAG: M67 family metallopeptidase [Methylococcales bacterium]
MQKTEIEIPRKIINQVLHHAQSSPDSEVCGLIGSRQGAPADCYPIKNTADDPTHRFNMDAKEQIDALRKIRKNDEELFAIYHSHPTSAPTPSTTDIEQANYPDVLSLIISLDTKGVLEMRGFYIKPNTPAEEVILLLTPN